MNTLKALIENSNFNQLFKSTSPNVTYTKKPV